MIRLSTLTVLAVLGTLAVSCSSAPPPFGTPQEAYRGFKARTFVGTPDVVRPAVLTSLRELGFEVHTDSDEANFISANKGMGGLDATIAGDTRTWIRVGVEIRFVDRHRRAPRTLVSVDAENVQGTSGGPISASFGSVPSSFYEDVFARIESRVPEPPVMRGLVPPQ